MKDNALHVFKHHRS